MMMLLMSSADMKNTLGKGFFLEWLDFVGDLLSKDCLVPVEKKSNKLHQGIQQKKTNLGSSEAVLK